MPMTFTPDSATIGSTEYFLASDSTTATYQTTQCILSAFIDLTNLVAGDQYQITLYEKINGSSARVIEQWLPTGAQVKPGFTIPPTLVGEGWEIGVKKLAGTDRAIGWSLRKIT